LKNLSESPLLYTIKKSGSIASDDIFVNTLDLNGIIRPFSHKEINFIFKPSLSGKFEESISVENHFNIKDNNMITIKAYIQQFEKFFVKENNINFGNLTLNSKSPFKKLIITNTSQKKIKLELELETKLFKEIHFDYDLEPIKKNSNINIEELEMELDKGKI
jgi:hypothetical protein